MADAGPKPGARVTAGDYFASGWYAAVGAFFAFAVFDGGDPALALGGVAYALLGPASVVLARVDKPKRWGAVAGLGLAAVAWFAFLASAGAWTFGAGATTAAAMGAVGAGGVALRRHKRVFRGERAPRIAAAALVLACFAALGWGGWRVLTNVVDAPNLNALLAAVYGIVGVKVALTFAAEGTKDEASDATEPDARTLRAWVRANGATLTALVLVLAAYAAARGYFAERVPLFPLVEFGLGVVLFGFVVAWLRNRVKKGLSEAPVANEWRAHAPRVQILRDPDFEAVHGPVRAFVDTGGGTREYATAVARAARLRDEDVARVVVPVTAYERPVPEPPLPLAWTAAAVAASTLGAGLAVTLLLTELFGAPVLIRGPFLLATAGLVAYRLQDDFRQRAQPWLALAPAAVGVLVLVLAFTSFLTTVVGSAPVGVWRFVGVAAFALLAVPALASWRTHRRLARGERPLARVTDADKTIREGIAKSRGRVTTLLTVALVLAFLVPPVLAWLAANPLVGDFHLVPRGFSEFYGHLVPAVAAALVGFAVANAVRAVGLTRARDAVVKRAERERARRLELHRSVMAAIADAVGR